MKKIKNAMLALAAFAAAGCHKDAKSPFTLDGSYAGKLYAVYKYDAYHTGPITDTVNLSLKDGRFGASSVPVSGTYPQYHGTLDTGTFKTEKDSVVLQNLHAYPDGFDHNLILANSYHFGVKADSLILTRVIGGNTYTYRLKKK